MRSCTNRQGSRALHTVLSSALFLAMAAPAYAQSGATPTYIQSMAPYSVRGMAGAYAPSNGTTNMRSVTPNEWLNNDPGSGGGIQAVLGAWSGGAKGTGAKLIINGGGHGDSANNGVYVFDFSGTDKPTGWAPLVVSPVSAVRSNVATYTDGKASAVHTYDGMVYASHNNHAYRVGGSRWADGFMTNSAFKYNLSTGTWTQLPNYPGQAGGGKSLYDAASGKVFVTMNETDVGYFLRTANDTWSAAKSYGGNGFPYDSVAAWDPTRNRGIVIGDGEMSLLSINFANETASVTSFSVTGPTAIFSQNGPSVIFDAGADVYWLLGGATNSSGWTTLYELNADGPPWVVTPHTLTGDAITRDASLIGSFGRLVLMDQWRAIGTLSSTSSPAYVIKLPAGPPVSPNPPTALTAQ